MKVTNQEILIMNQFDSITNVSPVYCFLEDNRIVFMVREKDMAKAIGKKGATVKKLSNIFKKKVEIVPYAKNPVDYVKTIFSPFFSKAEEIEGEKGKILKVELKGNVNNKAFDKNYVLKGTKQILKKTYGIKNIKILMVN